MEELSVYALFGLDEPPRKILGPAEPGQLKSVAVPAFVHQVVLFSNGGWGEHSSATVELRDAKRNPIISGKLTPKNKSLCWEYWEDGIWSSGATVSVKFDSEAKATGDVLTDLAKKEFTPECTTAAAPSVREAPGKRKRSAPEQEPEDATTTATDQENTCPNGQAAEKTTPLRKGRNAPRGSQTRLFSPKEEKPPASVQASVRSTPPPNPRARGRPAKTPTTQSAPLDHPSGRWGQSLCPIDSQTAILIGGQGAKMQFCKDPMWKLCTEDLSWVPAETLAEGPTPEARIGHTATYDPESKRIFVFGGSKSKKWFNDMHILDTQSWRWTMVEAQGKVPPLAYHSCSLFRGELFVFGGVFPLPHPQPDGCSDSIYIFSPDMSIWYQPIVNGDKPAPRSGHSACVIQGKIFIFGGWDTPVCFNDMYMLDLGLMEFSAVKTNGTPPSPRSWHGCALVSETRFLVHGGYNGNNALSDTFLFDTDTSSWTTIRHSQLTSVPRAGHSIIGMTMADTQGSMDEDQPQWSDETTPKTLLIFGGGDNEGSFFSDLITLSVEDLQD
ncbi:kelch repeat-containing protein [Engraulis encrasicolus]|uniref:kelch repeat-containing protein n=1 Tax=Engraulis encrasicolus TaxID=184585 RepID=UPI002FD17F43